MAILTAIYSKEGIFMEPIYRASYTILSTDCDPYNRIKPSALLSLMQEIAGQHCEGTPLGWQALAEKGMFFAVTRQHIQITRLPLHGETVTLETWPGPTSRVAFPRNTIAYDEKGNELFRAMSLWVLMDMNTRAMVLPGKCGISVPGLIRGNELAVPGSLAPRNLEAAAQRRVVYTELDCNGHMNNCRYMDWVLDLMPSEFHREHPLTDFTITYLSEAKEDETVDLHYELSPEGQFQVEATTADPEDAEKSHRVFAVRATFL